MSKSKKYINNKNNHNKGYNNHNRGYKMNFIRFLKINKNTRKVFGEREIKIIEKQSLGINLTQSEKNRLSRDIRRKLEFIEKAANFSEDFKLKKGAIIKEVVSEAQNVILNDILKNNITKIILFGSAIENKLTFKSDIDISVEFHKINLKEATLFRKRIGGKVNDKVDLQVYNILPDKIKKEIDKKGRILWEK